MLNLKAKKKVWLEYNGQPILGKGRYVLLSTIERTKSVKKSAKLCGLSEKTAHNHIKRIESRLKQNIIETKRGGKLAGGESVLTPVGKILISEFQKIDCNNNED
jgi:molybdate transport system regulatory protein